MGEGKILGFLLSWRDCIPGLPGQLYSQIWLQLLPSPRSGVCPKVSLLHKASLTLHKTGLPLPAQPTSLSP